MQFNVAKKDGSEIVEKADETDAHNVARQVKVNTGESCVLTPWAYNEKKGEWELDKSSSFTYPADGTEQDDIDDEYSGKTKDELVKIAEKEKVDVASSSTKAEILAALRADR